MTEPAEDYPAPDFDNEPDLSDLPDVVDDDPEDAAAGSVVDNSYADTLDDASIEDH